MTTNTGTSVRIQWVEPYNGGSAITALEIEIRAADAVTFQTEALYCNGVSDATVRAQGFCVIPMNALRVAPYSLQPGSLVVARLRASNAVGASLFSGDAIIPGFGYADVRTVPETPASPPTRGAATSIDRIEAVVQALTGSQTGGSPILSYHIEYDAAAAGAIWTELQGYSSNSLSLAALKSGLASATVF